MPWWRRSSTPPWAGWREQPWGGIEVALALLIGIALLNSPLPSGYSYPPSFVKAQELIIGSWLAPHFYGLFPVTKLVFAAVLPSSIGGYFTQLLQTS